MTAATPTLGPIVDISDGVGAVDMFNGYVSESQKGRFHKHSMQKISWTSANSLIATWAQGNDIKVAVISDTNNIAATTTNITAMDASSLPAGEFYSNGQMVDNGTGSYEVIAEINDTDNTTNEQVGRLVARSIDASGNLGIGFTDIGNKPATVAGGELSKAFARGNMVTFTKENGTSDQNTYFNRLA